MIADVGRRIAEIRVEQGWTQQQLANALGLSLQYVQRCETGAANLTLRSLVKIASALKRDPRRLLDPPAGTPTSIRESKP